LRALRTQTVKNLDILVIDSSSSDETVDIAKQHAIQTVIIPKEEFDHGGTRTLAGKTRSVGDILVYLTQDALPCDDRAIETLIQPLLAEKICGAVFGRQIAYQNATPFAQHLRLFNYPPQSYIRTYADRTALGIRAAFCSNSFAAYRRDALEEVGWFAENLLLAEDMHICARMLMRRSCIIRIITRWPKSSNAILTWGYFSRRRDGFSMSLEDLKGRDSSLCDLSYPILGLTGFFTCSRSV
jgi:rhamnosyltransferase